MKSSTAGRAGGFTLIELMIVASIISLLAAIAIPKFADLLKKSNEGATKGNLGSIRSALSIYYADNTGIFPVVGWVLNAAEPRASLVPRYLNTFPNVTLPYHTKTNTVYGHPSLTAGHEHDSLVAYLYNGMGTTDANWGNIVVACSHTDLKGSRWTYY